MERSYHLAGKWGIWVVMVGVRGWQHICLPVWVVLPVRVSRATLMAKLYHSKTTTAKIG